jgi:hypothetical protein
LEDLVKLPLNKERADIPDRNGKRESPLMELPVEVLDKIFCVRPEIAVSLSSPPSGDPQEYFEKMAGRLPRFSGDV